MKTTFTNLAVGATTNRLRTVAAIICATLFCGTAFSQVRASDVSQKNQPSSEVQDMLKRYEKKIYFSENKGQWATDILYKADFALGQAQVTKQGMLVATYDTALVAEQIKDGMLIEKEMSEGKPFRPVSNRTKGHAWLMNFVNSSPNMTIESKDMHTDKFNYFLGNPSQFATNVRTYQEVWYNNVYKNVDVRYYPSEDGTLEYDIICKPGFKNENITMKLDGIDKMHIAENGHLILNTSVGDVDFPAPVVYQKINGEQKSVSANYVVSNNNEVKFNLGSYDATQPLIIDPIALRWATWVNSNSPSDNHGHCVWVDSLDGSIYSVARVTGSTNFITAGAFDITANGGLDMIIGKYISPAVVGGAGTRVWQTYVGGSNDDNPYAIEQGADKNIYITGLTSSANFPLLGGAAFSGSSIDMRAESTTNIFVVKIDRLGSSIKGCVVGGNGGDGSYDIRANNAGEIVVCGYTSSTNLGTLYPASGATNVNNGANDVIVFKVNQDLSSMLWMNNYGGSSSDQANIMTMDPVSKMLYVAGFTSSANFPVLNPRAGQAALVGSKSGFLQKFGPTGTMLWSSYFNSAAGQSTSILCMEFNATKSQLYFGGLTSGLNATNIIAINTFDNSYNGGSNDFFVARIDTNQANLLSTYLGGSGNEVNMMGLNADKNNSVFVFGYSNSSNFPTSACPLQGTNHGQNDKVFIKLNTTLSTLLYSTYYGGSSDDYDPVGERGIKFANCRAYTIYTSKSNDIPLTQGALNTTKLSNIPYEPALVEWAEPDLLDNSVTGNQGICAGTVPAQITGSMPIYDLPTILRNNVPSVYPALCVSALFQWQISTNGITWTNIPGATGQNLPSAFIGPLYQTTYFRRVISGDFCVLLSISRQIVTITVFPVPATSVSGVNISCNGGNNGTATVSASGGSPAYTYSWNTTPVQTTSVATNLPAGTYSATVTDAHGCISTTPTVTITQPTLLAAATTPTNALCFGSTGSASVSANGGTPGYSYLWNTVPAQTTALATGLAAGNYTVTVSDLNGCTTSQNVAITQPTLLTASISNSSNVSCNGGNNGTASALGAGGTPGYSFVWNTVPAQTTASATGLAAGSYSVTITDANGCIAVQNVVITQPPVLTTSVNVSNTNCNGANNGTATATGSGGTPGYLYTWNTIPAQNTATATGLATGNYIVTTTDANGCTATQNAIINQPTLLVSGISNSTNVSCNGGNNGTATVTSSGGTPVYSYSWNTIPVQTTSVATGLAAGNYTVTILDANSCQTSQSVTIAQPTPLTALTSTTPALCSGVANGSASATASGGTSSYTYSWNTVPVQNTQTAIGLLAGNYVVTVKDANGCTITQNAVVAQPTTLVSGIANSVNVSCNGGNNGSATVTANGGSGTFNYSWSPSGGNAATANNLAAGNYVVTITDANGCSTTSNAVITQPTVLISSISNSTNVSCFGGNNGSASVVASGGTSAYAYSWSPIGGSNATANNLPAGNYTVTTTDAHGCSTASVVSISQPSLLVSAISSSTNVNCNGGNNGSATVNVNGGTAGYNYSWSPSGGNGATANNLPAGNYIVTVTDAHGCTSASNVAITQPALLVSSISNSTNVSCHNGNNGTATATANGGTAPYMYSWSPSGGNNATANNLAAGNYNVTVTDAHGCTTLKSVTITQPTPVLLSVNTPAKICYGQSAIISANATGGVSPYSYSWNNGVSSASQSVSPTTATSYSVMVTDANGCPSSNQTVLVNVFPQLNVSATASSAVCSGQHATVSATAGGGNGGPYTYSWNNGAFHSSSAIVTPIGDSTFTVMVSDGCSPPVQTSVTVHINPSPVVNFTPANSEGCAPVAVNFVDASTTTPGSTYLWTLGDGSTSTSPTFVHTYTAGGQYSVSLTVTSAQGCIASKTALHIINVYGQPQAGFSTSEEVITSLSPTVYFNDLSSGAAYWQWDFGDGSTVSNEVSPSHTYSEIGTYTIRQVVETIKGCFDTTYRTVTVIEGFTFYIPNAFTPNFDGTNDGFGGKGEGVKDYDMVILNRWGGLIYHSYSMEKTWDGTYFDNGNICQNDVYVYKINVHDPAGKLHEYIGHVTLVR